MSASGSRHKVRTKAVQGWRAGAQHGSRCFDFLLQRRRRETHSNAHAGNLGSGQMAHPLGPQRRRGKKQFAHLARLRTHHRRGEREEGHLQGRPKECVALKIKRQRKPAAAPTAQTNYAPELTIPRFPRPPRSPRADIAALARLARELRGGRPSTRRRALFEIVEINLSRGRHNGGAALTPRDAQ